MRKTDGFTLIELVIAVAVVAVLAAIAAPSFLDQIRKARRADAITALEDVQLGQSQFRANCPEYADSIGNARACVRATSTYQMIGETTSPGGYYRISIVSADDDEFVAKAHPIAGTSQASDNACGDFAIDAYGPYHSGYADEDCWRR